MSETLNARTLPAWIGPEPCDYCGTTLPDDYPRHECPVCGTQACAECSCGRGTAHFDCETT